MCVFARVWLVDQTDYYETPLRFLLGCMESFRKRTPLTDILIADIEAEFPGILDRLTGGVDHSVQEVRYAKLPVSGMTNCEYPDTGLLQYTTTSSSLPLTYDA